jgi:hypothetical protein
MILEKYKGTLADGRALPVTANQYSNVYLKKLDSPKPYNPIALETKMTDATDDA